MSFERCRAYISEDALVNNIKAIRTRLDEGTFFFAVVKADAYGHGSEIAAPAIEELVDGFAVACVDEGAELRREGIKKPVLILGYTSPSRFGDMIENDLMASIWRYSDAETLNEAAAKHGKTALIHIAADTGMNRVGFRGSDNCVFETEKISHLPNIEINGIFTHLSCADMASDEARAYTDEQLKEFRALVEKLKEKGINIPLKHAYNSAAVIERKDAFFNCIRCGIIIYGLYPSDEVKRIIPEITPVMQFKSAVINVFDLPKGCAVSYGATYISDRDMKAATVSAGYADGYPRLLSGKGRVLIRGRFAPILGRVCMDQFMVDVTDIPDVKVEDEVTLFGTDGNNSIPVEEIAGLAGTINYEIVCGISKRVPRVLVPARKT